MKYVRTRAGLRVIGILVAGIVGLLAVFTILLANTARSALLQHTNDRYQADAHDISAKLLSSLNGYVDLLYDGRALVRSSQEITPSEWKTYFDNLDVYNRYKGFSLISRTEVVANANKQSFLANKRANPEYGAGFDITPKGTRDKYAAGTLYVSNTQTTPLGFDFFSDHAHHMVHDMAFLSGQPTMSAQMPLSTGDNGFFITLPINQQNEGLGCITIFVNTQNFFNSVLAADNLTNSAIKVTDDTELNQTQELFKSSYWRDAATAQRYGESIKVAGRDWKIYYVPQTSYADTLANTLLPGLILIIGLVLLGTIVIGFLFFSRYIRGLRDESNVS